MEFLSEAVKMVAVNFAEWLSKNKWIKRVLTHPNKVGMYWSDIHCEYKTIEDLYEMFRLEEQIRLKTNEKRRYKKKTSQKRRTP